MVDDRQPLSQMPKQVTGVYQGGNVAAEIAADSTILVNIVAVSVNHRLAEFDRVVEYLHTYEHAQRVCRIAAP